MAGDRGSMRVGLAALAALAVLAWLLIGARAEARGLPKHFFGVDSIFVPEPVEFAQMRDSGAQVYRMSVLWREIEPQAPVELGGRTIRSYDFTGPDEEMRRAISGGLRPHVALIGSPAWVADDIRATPMRSEAGRKGWPHYVVAVLKRYGPAGSFWEENPELPKRPPVAYQVWNEQNSEVAYQPRADPVEYARMFRQAAKRIRSLAPEAQILPGGMFGTPQLDRSYYAWDFLDVFLRQPGVRPHLDAVAAHPYAPRMRGLRYQLRKFRQALRRAKLRRLPLQITEIGWSSEKRGGVLFNQGIKGQAKMTNKAMREFVKPKRRKRWRIERVLWFTWRDVTENEAHRSGCGFCQKMGLVGTDLQPKPAYRKWVRWAKRR
jgi:hypothetical protein